MSDQISVPQGPDRAPENIADSVAWQKEQLADLQRSHTAQLTEAGIIVTAMGSLRSDVQPTGAVVCFDRLKQLGDNTAIDRTVGVSFRVDAERWGRTVSGSAYVPVVGIDGNETAHAMGDFTPEQAALILGLSADLDFARVLLPNLSPDGTSIFDPTTAMQRYVPKPGDTLGADYV